LATLTSASEFRVPFFRRSTTVSNQGFSITLISSGSRERLDYQDQLCHCLLDVEFAASTVVVLRRSLSDKQGSSLSSMAELKVYQNVRRALEWRGWIVEVAP
jgi:hypothetical protein